MDRVREATRGVCGIQRRREWRPQPEPEQPESQPEQENWPEEVEAAVWRRRLRTPQDQLLPYPGEMSLQHVGGQQQDWDRIEPRPWQSEMDAVAEEWQGGGRGSLLAGPQRHTSQAGAKNMCAPAGFSQHQRFTTG